jgi:hypothetical protein
MKDSGEEVRKFGAIVDNSSRMRDEGGRMKGRKDRDAQVRVRIFGVIGDMYH